MIRAHHSRGKVVVVSNNLNFHCQLPGHLGRPSEVGWKAATTADFTSLNRKASGEEARPAMTNVRTTSRSIFDAKNNTYYSSQDVRRDPSSPKLERAYYID